MYTQTVATILMDEEMHDILNGNSDMGLQEYVLINDENEICNLIKKLEEENENKVYISLTVEELKDALTLLQKDEIQSILFVYSD